MKVNTYRKQHLAATLLNHGHWHVLLLCGHLDKGKYIMAQKHQSLIVTKSHDVLP